MKKSKSNIMQYPVNLFKKITALLLLTSILICIPVYSTGCENNPKETTDIVRIAALKGNTAMGLVNLMKENEDGKSQNKYEFSLVTTDEIVPLIAKGEADIAAVPANLASVLYNNTEKNIYVIAVNTLGVLYIVEKGGEINSIEDLKGKTVYATGKGVIPEYTINHILQANGIDPEKDLTIEYKAEPAEVLSILATSGSENAIAMLPQPFVTNALRKVDGLKISLDLTAEWDKVKTDNSTLITGVAIVRKEFADQYPNTVKKFLDEYKKSAEHVNSNIDDAAELIGKYDIVTADIAKESLPYCNITFIKGNDMKEKLSAYLQTLYEQNPQSVGGTLPDEEFYYIK